MAIKGHPGDLPPAEGGLADYLLLRHHSTVELLDRAEAAGLVRRLPDAEAARVVRVMLTAKGDRLVTELTGSISASYTSLRRSLDELTRDRQAASEPAEFQHCSTERLPEPDGMTWPVLWD